MVWLQILLENEVRSQIIIIICERLQKQKYKYFVFVAFETLGPINSSCHLVIAELRQWLAVYLAQPGKREK